MQGLEKFSNFPDNTQKLNLISDDESQSFNMELSSELVKDVATPFLTIGITDHLNDVNEETVQMKLSIDDLNKVIAGLRKMYTLMSKQVK